MELYLHSSWFDATGEEEFTQTLYSTVYIISIIIILEMLFTVTLQVQILFWLTSKMRRLILTNTSKNNDI
jgi:hypothetical protein